jgi:hypothetical protein
MSTILIVEKSGVIKETSLKTFSELDLYKKAGFKTNDGFACQHKWTMEIDGESTTVSLFAKTTGRAGQENKYDFPPPVDTVLFFGACVLVANVSEDGFSCDSLKKNRWEAIYEALFGGFEDIGDEDSEISEDDVDPDVPRTKDGYVKDGFIVDDDDEDDDDDDEDDDDDDDDDGDEEDEIIEKPKKLVKKAPAPKASSKEKISKKKTATVFDKIDTMNIVDKDTTFLDCTSELEEEMYEE